MMTTSRAAIHLRVPRGRKRISVGGEEYHHLIRVTRAREGDPVGVLDGSGGVYETRIVRIERGKAVLDIEAYRREPEPPAIDMALALTKAHRLDIAVEKCTELGMRAFIPFSARRSVWRGGSPEAVHKRNRLERKVIAACKQSGNPYFPAVREVHDFERLIAALGRYDGVYVADRGGDPAPGGPSPGDRILGIVGPEGGLTEREREELLGAGARAVSLGRYTLRSETAAVCLLYSLHELFAPRGA